MAVKRAAIIGWGDVAPVHAAAIQAMPDATLVAIADNDPARRDVALIQSGADVYASTEELLARADVDVIHITTPHDSHVDPALEALAQGKAVLCEKPLGAHLDDAKRLVEASKTATSKIGVCYQNRYNNSSKRMAQLVESGDLGEIAGAWASLVWTRTLAYYREKPWRGNWNRSGGGLLINQAIHTLDLILWLLGPVTHMDGGVSSNKFVGLTEVEDTAHLYLTHDQGIQTSFFATLTAPSTRPVELEIQAENGVATIRDGITIEWKNGTRESLAERTAPSRGRSYWGLSHELLIADFYASLDDPEPFWLSPSEAMKSLELLKRAYELTPHNPIGERT